MATISQIYSNLVIGGVIATGCFAGFGIAIRVEANKNLTPRAWARPVQILKNVLSPPYSLAWIRWAMKLRYIDLLSGIPGTGTRKGGWSGPTLRTNLDGVVLLRYHTLQFKVSVLATLLCIGVLVPVYYTSTCDIFISGIDACKRIENNTDFEKLTVANIPSSYEIKIVNENGTLEAVTAATNFTNPALPDNIIKSITLQWLEGITGRYLAVVLVVISITCYTCYLLWYEWVECLALRRVYYLESDYYEERLDELDDILVNSDQEDPFQKVRPPFLPHPEMRETIPNVSLNSALYKLPHNLCSENLETTTEGENKSLLERQLEATEKFFDQCIPPQRGYTSSVAAITMIPDAGKLTKVWGTWYRLGSIMRRIRFLQSVIKLRKEMKLSGQRGMHDFFVVAPAHAFKATTEKMMVVKEYTTEGIETMTAKIAGGLKEFKQKRIKDEAEGQSKELSVSREQSDDDAESIYESCRQYDPTEDLQTPILPNDDFPDMEDSTDVMGKSTIHEEKTTASVDIVDGKSSKCDAFEAGKTHTAFEDGPENTTDNEIRNSNVPGLMKDTAEHFEYEEFDPVTFAKWIGYREETELDQMIDTLEIEQLSVYAREMSQSASNCCVYGCAPEARRFASIEQLETELEDEWNSAREANALLLLARAEMFKETGGQTIEIPGSEISSMKKNVDEKPSTDIRILSSIEEKEKSQEDHEANKLCTTIAEEREMESGKIAVHSNRGGGNTDRDIGLRLRKSRVQRSSRFKYDLAQDLIKETHAASYPTAASRQETKGSNHSKMLKCMNHDAVDLPSYCVVTFTCRQAAIAARQCIADGKGINSWEQVQNIPMYPLADAPSCNICFCRGCCRPVTPTISHQEKRARKIFTWAFYITFCALYTIPLTVVSQILNPTWLAAAFPQTGWLQDPDNFFYKTLAGISSGYVQTIFYMVLPQIFKLLSLFEGSSTSKAKAEENATRFYWYFMLVTAFTGSSLANMFLNGLAEGNVGYEFKDILATVASSLATQTAPTWVNWIIVRTFNVLPFNYLCQGMVFVYGWIRIHWLNRVVRGGGPGGPPPYRIYVDSGVVFMCITSIAPSCPIIAPIASVYYMLFIPMLRWLHIFVYRPWYDGGGHRLPVIHEIIISSLILGQWLTGSVLLLRQSFILGLITMLMSLPTYWFSAWTKEKFERSYEDAGLFQTSKLDVLFTNGTMEEREKYRRWLVDCHKASYVPMCVLGGEDFLTSQPAAVQEIPIAAQKSSPKLSPKHGMLVAQKGAL